MPINYRDYHPKWSLIRRLILKRANHCCEECTVKNYAVGYRIEGKFYTEEEICDILDNTGYDLTDKLPAAKQKAVKIVLTVAHVDHDIKNNDFGNLRAWCQRCHLNHDRKNNARRRKYGKRFILTAQTLF